MTLKNLRLESFQIIDWLSRSPGLYPTRDAAVQRIWAHQDLTTMDGVTAFSASGRS
jgi:hypothetical protein